MSDDLLIAIERVRQKRDAGVSNQNTPVRTTSENPQETVGMLRAGNPVFDLVSGQHGTVIDSVPLGASLTAPIGVRLDTGVRVVRALHELVPRPTPPRASA